MQYVTRQTADAAQATPEAFKQDTLTNYKPAVVRGYVKDWKAVEIGKRSPSDLANYISSFDQGRDVVTYYSAPEVAGHMFYTESMDGFNFERIPEKLSDSLNRIVKHIKDERPPCVYTGAVDIAQNLPGFADDNRCDLAGQTAVARIWVGNAATVSTHYDLLDNIVCAVSGRRRFTLFPPEQLKNLYVGPIDFTLSGQPVSMVDIKDPGFTRFPKFREALEHAEVVDLEPGDVLFIPKLWWHHVESLDPFNAIVNYWWDQTAFGPDPAFATLLHGIATISHLPEAERKAWKAFFDHYVFQLQQSPVEHIQPEKHGVLGKMTPSIYQKLKRQVIALMTQR